MHGRKISLEKDKRKGLATFVYPMISLCGMAVFASVFLYNIGSEDLTRNQLFQLAMTRCCGVFVAFFAGYFLAAKTVSKMARSMFRVDCDLAKSRTNCGICNGCSFCPENFSRDYSCFFNSKIDFSVLYHLYNLGRRKGTAKDE